MFGEQPNANGSGSKTLQAFGDKAFIGTSSNDPVKRLRPRGRITRESNARARLSARVSENHGLNRHRRAEEVIKRIEPSLIGYRKCNAQADQS